MSEPEVREDRVSDTASPVRIVVDLQATPERDVMPEWREALAFMAVPTLLDEADGPKLRIQVDISHFGAAIVSTTTYSHPQRNVRTAATVAVTRMSHVVFQLYDRGWSEGTCGGRDVSTADGRLLAIDLAQPYDLVVHPCVVCAIMVPRDELPPPLREREIGGLAPPSGAAARLFADALRSLAINARHLSMEEGLVGARALIALAQTVFVDAGSRPPPELDETRLHLRERAKVLVEDRLRDPKLTIADLAAALGCSRATLHRLFEPEGGPTLYLRERRLVRVYETIVGDLAPGHPLGAVASAHGFASDAHFSRAFKARFGSTPGQVRDEARALRLSGEGLPTPPASHGMPSQMLRSRRVPKRPGSGEA